MASLASLPAYIFTMSLPFSVAKRDTFSVILVVFSPGEINQEQLVLFLYFKRQLPSSNEPKVAVSVLVPVKKLVVSTRGLIPKIA